MAHRQSLKRRRRLGQRATSGSKPYDYLLFIPGEDIRTQLLLGFNAQLHVDAKSYDNNW